MDKELQALWDRVVEGSKRAKAAGDTLSADEIDAFLKEKSGGKYGLADITATSLRNLGRSFAQGLTMNFGDEALGAVAGDTQQEDMRLRDRLYREAHPVASGAAELAGGVLPFLLPGIGEAKAVAAAGKGVGAAAKAAAAGADVATTSIPRLMARGAATGAITGSVAGAGAGEDAASRASGAATGGVIGGLLGGAIPAVVGGAGYLADEARPAARMLRAQIERSGGLPTVQAALQKFEAAGKGGEVMTGDLTPQLRALTEHAATVSPVAKDMVERAVAERQGGMTQRLLQDLEASSPGIPKDATTFAANIHDASSKWARGAYDELRGTYTRVPNTALGQPPVPPAAQKLRGFIQSALDQGIPESHPMVQSMKAQYNQLVPPLTRAEEDFLQTLNQPFAKQALRRAQIQTQIGELTEDRMQPSFEKLQAVKEMVGDAANRAWKNGEGGLGQRLNELRNILDGHLIDNIPEYSAVTQEYAKRMNLERVLQKGVDAWGDTDTAGLKALVAKLSPAELFQYRAGMASELAAKLRNTATNRDVAKQLLDASIAKDEKLAVIFGDKAHFDMFMQKAQAEAQMAKLRGTYTGSATAYRESLKQSDPTNVALTLGSHSMAVPGWNYLKSGLARAAAGITRRDLMEQNAQHLAPLVTMKGTPAIDALLQRIMNPAPIMGTGATMAAPAAAGNLAAQMFSQPR